VLQRAQWKDTWGPVNIRHSKDSKGLMCNLGLLGRQNLKQGIRQLPALLKDHGGFLKGKRGTQGNFMRQVIMKAVPDYCLFLSLPHILMSHVQVGSVLVLRPSSSSNTDATILCIKIP
jgi:hypothetical protein